MILDTKEYVDANGRLIDHQYENDKMLNANVDIQLDKKVVAYRVKHQTLGQEGKIVERCVVNAILNSLVYEV